MDDQTLNNIRISVDSLGFDKGSRQDVAVRVDTRGIRNTAPAGGQTHGIGVFLDQLKDIFKVPSADIASYRKKIDDGESFELEVKGTMAQLKQSRFIPRNT